MQKRKRHPALAKKIIELAEPENGLQALVKSGCVKNTIYTYVSNQSSFPVEVIWALAKYFNIPATELFLLTNPDLEVHEKV